MSDNVTIFPTPKANIFVMQQPAKMPRVIGVANLSGAVFVYARAVLASCGPNKSVVEGEKLCTTWISDKWVGWE